MTAIIIISAIILFFMFLLASFIKVELEYDAEFFVKVKYLCFTLFMMPKSKRKLKKEKKKEEKERKKQERLRKKRHKGQHLKTAEKKKPSKVSCNAGRSVFPEEQSKRSEKSKNSKNADFENRSLKRENVKVQKTANGKKERDEKTDKTKPSLEMILDCVKAAKPYVKRLFKKIRFDDVFVEIVVGGDDAAKTAVSYGVHCAAAHGLVCFLKNTVSFKAKKIDIKANFDLEKTDYYAYGKIKLRLSTLLFCAIWGFFAVYKAMKSNDTLNKTNGNNSKDTIKKAA